MKSAVSRISRTTRRIGIIVQNVCLRNSLLMFSQIYARAMHTRSHSRSRDRIKLQFFVIIDFEDCTRVAHFNLAALDWQNLSSDVSARVRVRKKDTGARRVCRSDGEAGFCASFDLRAARFTYISGSTRAAATPLPPPPLPPFSLLQIHRIQYFSALLSHRRFSEDASRL